MSLIRTIGPIDLIPRGYGFAYWKHDSMLIVVALIPLNLVIGAAYAALGWLMSAPIAWEAPRHRVVRKSYRLGHRAGFKAGKAEGYREWTTMRDRKIIELEAGREAAMQAFDRFADRLMGRER